MLTLEIKDKVVLVTGSNRGIGKSFVEKALELGAAKVYATARNTGSLADLAAANPERVVLLNLDICNQEQVDAVAAAAQDVDVLINNAGAGGGGAIVAANNEAPKRMEMDINYFGTMKMAVAFAPIVKAKGGGAIVNILSISGLCSFAFAPGYSASKAAGHSLTQALRAELAKQNTLVIGVYPGPIDTDMAKHLPFDKASPDSVATHVFNALATGEEDVFPDPFSVEFVKQLRIDAKAVEKANGASA